MSEVSASHEQVLKTLQDLGFTRLDSQIYIYLAKKGTHRGAEITKALKVQKQPLYRCLKHLQSKGIVTATLEHPARFAAVSFEKVVDIFVKAKMAEAQSIEENKSRLLANWQALAVEETADTSSKFSVIEGRGPIYSKIMQMIQETKTCISTISTIKGLLRANQFGVFDTVNSNSSKIKYHVLTQLSKQEVPAIRNLLNEMNTADIPFEARTPELGLNLFPEMVIRDEEETVFFISPLRDTQAMEQSDVCLWTNCKSLVQAMATIFEDLWHNSTDIQNKIETLETGRILPKTLVFADAETAHEKYNKAIASASNEITILTYSEALTDLTKQDQLLANWATKQMSVRIMAPITRTTVNAVQQLLKTCQVKHVPVGYLGTTIVDGKEMCQFKNPQLGTEQQGLQCFENAFYSNDLEYVEKTKKMMDDMWRNAQDPPAITFETLSEPYSYDSDILAENYPTRKMIGLKVVNIKRLTEKEVITKIIHGKKLHVNNPEKDTHKIYSTGGSAIIHPPSYLNLPDLMLEMAQIESQSSLGAANVLTVYQWLNTPIGIGYAPVAYILTNAEAFEASKQLYKDTPAGGNVHLVKEDELQIRIHGNTMFAGWTNPIPLFPRKVALPPACLTLEGYGKVHPVGYTTLTYYGAKSIVEKNYFDAFVTFMHPRSKYSGPGTDGFFCRDHIVT
ncbi:MAG: TrmB family transcriptional regulator, partial [Candidatus Bathyarchaeia archaeon]